MSKPSFIDLVHDFAEARHKHGAAEYNPITRAALDALLAEVEGLRLPASYSGSQLLTVGDAVRVTFAFTDLAQAEAWHEKLTAAADAAQSAKEAQRG